MNRFLLCLFLIIPLINCKRNFFFPLAQFKKFIGQRNQYFFSGRNSEFNVGNGNQAPLTSFTLNSYLMDTEFKEISFGISHTLFLLSKNSFIISIHNLKKKKTNQKMDKSLVVDQQVLED